MKGWYRQQLSGSFSALGIEALKVPSEKLCVLPSYLTPYGNITMPRAAKDTKATKAKKATVPAEKAADATKATPKKAALTTKPEEAATKPKALVNKPKTAAKRAPRASKKGAGEQFNNFEPYKTKRGEKYMNELQRAHFKSILVNWKSELMQEVDRTVNHMKDEAANFPDPADRATQEEEFSLELRTRDRERKLIKKIDSTMELIEQNDYGYCEACGIEIGIQRLEARPTATQCIDCKTLAEIKEKQEMG
jgi:DnaK suppressor protein